jgi:integrase
VNCCFDRLRIRQFQRSKKISEETIQNEIEALLPKLSPVRLVRGNPTPKRKSDLRVEARRKVLNHFARQYVPRFSLYALRHAWATRALQSGVDGLTVAILMGHSDPSTLARVYQHLSHNPEHLFQQAQRATGGT